MNRRKVLMGAAAAAACAVVPVSAATASRDSSPDLTLKILRLYRQLTPANQAIFLAELRKMDAGLPNAIEGTAPNLLRRQAA